MTECDVDKCTRIAEWTGIWQSHLDGGRPCDGKRWNWCDECYLAAPGIRVLCTQQIEVLSLTQE